MKNFKKITFVCSTPKSLGDYSTNYDFLVPSDTFNKVGQDLVVSGLMRIGNFDKIVSLGFSISQVKIEDKSYKRTPKSFKDQKDLVF